MTSKKKLLVLDLDGTLIHAEIDGPNGREDYDFSFELDGEIINVWKRPFLDKFIRWAFENFEVAIWSASDMDYIKYILHAILPDKCKPLFVWSRKKCTFKRVGTGLFPHQMEIVTIKKLQKVWKTRQFEVHKKNVLIVDDKPSTYSKNYGNALPICCYKGNVSDQEFLRIIKALEELKEHPNPLRVEKRPQNPLYLQM